MTNKDIGKEFGISYSAVSKAYSSILGEIRKSGKVDKEMRRIISHFKG